METWWQECADRWQAIATWAIDHRQEDLAAAALNGMLDAKETLEWERLIKIDPDAALRRADRQR
jgi:hypothetical protein